MEASAGASAAGDAAGESSLIQRVRILRQGRAGRSRH